MAKMDEAWLRHVAVGMRIAAIIFDVSTMITQGATLQQPAAVSKVASLVAPVAAIRYMPIIGKPRLSDKALTL
jgi:uncharacterized membrane protein